MLKQTKWIARIKESSSKGKWVQVISHYNEMRRDAALDSSLVETETDVSLFPPVLKACSFLSYRHGTSFHANLIKQGLVSFTSIANSVLDFYLKCGNLNAGTSVFGSMSFTDSVSWNILIHGYLTHDALLQGLSLFKNAKAAAFQPNISTLVLMLGACSRLVAKRQALQLHGYIVCGGFCEISSVQNALLRMYTDDCIQSATKLFDEIRERDVISWSIMISGYVHGEEPRFGLRWFSKMVSSGEFEPDGVIVVSVLKACADLGEVNFGRIVHGLAICRGLNFDLFVANSLVDMYSKCFDVASASKVFHDMSWRNIISWNSMLSGLVLNEQFFEAQSLVCSMWNEAVQADDVTLVNILHACKYYANGFQCKSVHCVMIRREFESKELVLNSLVDTYAKCGLVELAWEVFVRMKRKDLVSWSTMIAGFAHCGRPDEAVSAFIEFNKVNGKPNAVTIINLLEACSVSADLKRAKWAHGIAIRRCLAKEVAVGTAILDLYSKCGDIESSKKSFDQIPHKNVVTWSSLIAAYSTNGFPREALNVLAKMKLNNLVPNSVTALSVLTACNHGGLVDEGLLFFESMVQDHGIDPKFEHFSCIIDMLARAGKLEIAMELVNKMPKNFKGRASVWGALLSACRNYGNTVVGERVARCLLELEPLKSTGYLLASGMYAADGCWVNAAHMRFLAKERGVRIVAGYSLIHFGTKSKRFVAGDYSHPVTVDIRYSVQQLHHCMKINNLKDMMLICHV